MSKEIYEETKDGWIKTYEYQAAKAHYYERCNPKTAREKALDHHRLLIKIAIKAGKLIPYEVLGEYFERYFVQKSPEGYYIRATDKKTNFKEMVSGPLSLEDAEKRLEEIQKAIGEKPMPKVPFGKLP